MIRLLFVGALFLFGALNARSETYENWTKSSPPHPPIVFKGWIPATSTSVNIADTTHWLFSPPVGRLFGHLDLSAFPSTDFPIHVIFYYRHIGGSSINPNSNPDAERQKNWSASTGYLAPDAVMDDLIYRREIEVKSEGEASIPVWSIVSPSFGRDYSESGNDNAYSISIEVAGRDGVTLARQQLIEAVSGGQGRSVTLVRAGVDTGQFLNDRAEKCPVDQIPLDTRVFEDIDTLWLDEDTLHKSEYTDDFWRQVFFGGTKVIGKPAQVQELAQRLGITPNQRVLSGGLWTTDYPVESINKQSAGTEGNYALDIPKEQDPFRWDVDLGRGRVEGLRLFSFWFLIVFTVVEIASIVGCLYLLRGYQRVFRWVLIPLSAIVYTLLGFLIVHLTLDFSPDVQVFQTIYSVEGWPDGQVRMNTGRLAFDNGRETLTAPVSTELATLGTNSELCPIFFNQTPDGVTISLRQKYGKFSYVSTRYWIKSESPCRFTTNGEVIATRPLVGAWIWDGSFWRSLGPLKVGEPVSIAKAPIVVNPAVIPEKKQVVEDSRLFPRQTPFSYTLGEMCSLTYMNSLKNTNVGMLLAVDDFSAPGQLADEKESKVRRQTILVHQFSLNSLHP